MPRNLMGSAHLWWKHISDTVYHVTDYGHTKLVVRAYGPMAMVVDKHLTAMTTKSTTNLDRFDKLKEHGADHFWWFVTEGPDSSAVDRKWNSVLNHIAEHHESYLSKLIVEYE